VLSGMPPVIYGNGEQSRDYTYIADAVRAYDLVLNRKEPLPGPVNFGSGKDVTIMDLAKKIIEVCGKSDTIKPTHVEPRIGEVNRLIANPAKAKKLLGWQTEYTLEKGLAEFLNWYKQYGLEERTKLE